MEQTKFTGPSENLISKAFVLKQWLFCCFLQCFKIISQNSTSWRSLKKHHPPNWPSFISLRNKICFRVCDDSLIKGKKMNRGHSSLKIGPYKKKLFCSECFSVWRLLLHVRRYANEDMLWLGHPRQWLRLTKVHKAASASLIKALSNYRIVINRLLCVFLPSLLVSKVCLRSI